MALAGHRKVLHMSFSFEVVQSGRNVKSKINKRFGTVLSNFERFLMANQCHAEDCRPVEIGIQMEN